MKPLSSPNVRLATAVCLLAQLSWLPAPAQNYTLTPLPPLAGDTYSGAYALNESGQAAGYSGNRAVVWTDGVPKNIQTLPGATSSVAYALNDAGHAAGNVSPWVSNSGAFYWNGSMMQRIIPPAGEYIVEAYAMNNAGAVVGPGGVATFGYRWQGSAFAALGTLPGDHTARPLAINHYGVAAGSSMGSSSGRRPVVWAPTTAQLVALPGGASQGIAWGLNDLGMVVGEYYTAGATRPFAWSSGTGAIALPLPPGAAEGYAWAVNNVGDIIGAADSAPVLWRRDAGGAYTVVPLAGRVAGIRPEDTKLYLYAINEAGQIAGEGRVDGEWRGFILNPTPALRLVLRTDADRSGTTDFETATDATAPGSPF